MLGPAKTYAMSVEIPRRLRVGRSVRIGAHPDVTMRISPCHQRLKGVIQSRFNHRRLAGQNLAIGAIYRDHIAFLKHLSIGCG